MSGLEEIAEAIGRSGRVRVTLRDLSRAIAEEACAPRLLADIVPPDAPELDASGLTRSP